MRKNQSKLLNFGRGTYTQMCIAMELPLNWMCHAHKHCMNISVQISLRNSTPSYSASKGFTWKCGWFHVWLYSGLISPYAESSFHINFVLILYTLSTKTFIWTHPTHYLSVNAITHVIGLAKTLWQYFIYKIILCQV